MTLSLRWPLLLGALVAGFAIGWMDSSPGFDDTGVTAGALLIVAGLFAFISGRRPWLWGFLLGVCVPVLDLLRTGSPVASPAIVFALAGAFAGWAARQTFASAPDVRSRR